MNTKYDKDLEKIITEQPSKYEDLDKMSVSELIEGINKEDAYVHKAVKKALPQIENLIQEILRAVLHVREHH